jgi:predicted RNA-binding protein YlqC (UPF0109 family)
MDPCTGIREFLNFFLTSLLREPEHTTVSRTDEEGGRIVFTINSTDDDLARIAGRNGRGAIALRNLVEASARLHGFDATLRIPAPKGGGRPFGGGRRPHPHGGGGGGGGRPDRRGRPGPPRGRRERPR